MSAHDEDDYEVGYRKPPKHSRFKPGQSGNPRGRPVTLPRADTPGQIGRDFRAVSNMTVKGSNGEEVPMMKAMAMALANAGLKGKASAAKTFLRYLEQGNEENVARCPGLKLIDDVDLVEVNRRRRSKARMGRLLKDLAERSRKN